jgi:hypothetical protein
MDVTLAKFDRFSIFIVLNIFISTLLSNYINIPQITPKSKQNLDRELSIWHRS